ncbi:MAG: putative ATP-dependent RNA helicase dhr2 [Alyxoria varia]|nr:MAG: putative ATP-dependent RNA helicase dhr2 [Alyxoria varia]
MVRPSANDRTRHNPALSKTTSKLPISNHVDEFLACFGKSDVTLLSGETGSGKSTQVPQYLHSESWCTKCIAVTQPRRVAAINLARRVAEELHTTLGSSSPASKVGYSVRFDNNVSPAIRIKYLTEGMLLQEMLRDPWLKQYSAVIVDEVHERSVNVDLILGFLRRIASSDDQTIRKKRGHRLKVGVMSATQDVQGLVEFFEKGFGTVQGAQPEAELEWNGFGDEDGCVRGEAILYYGNTFFYQYVSNDRRSPSSETINVQNDRTSTCFVEGRQYPVKALFLPEAVEDYTTAAARMIYKIHYEEALPGDVLVFLPGQDSIESLERLMVRRNEELYEEMPEVPRVAILPLFAALSPSAQQAVFKPAPRNTRKVILATNIAESSITIPGVRYVVDSGVAKFKEFRSQLGLDTLLEKPISKSSAKQRAGRAGREGPGKCYRLYTEEDWNQRPNYTTPEILKCDLASALIVMKARGVEDILSFPLLTPPRIKPMRKALWHLYRLDALNDKGAITRIGKLMSGLPLTPSLARVVIAASDEEDPTYLLDVIDIVAALSVENIFLNIDTDPDIGQDDEVRLREAEEHAITVEEARKTLYRREGDHMTYLAAVQAYTGEHVDRRAWCDRHAVSHRAMRAIMDARKQLRIQCSRSSMLPSDAIPPSDIPEKRFTATPERASMILRCFMKGFATNVARLVPDGSYKTVEGSHLVAIHPSSVMVGRKAEVVLYNELVFTSRNYMRGVSAVELEWYAQVHGV